MLLKIGISSEMHPGLPCIQTWSDIYEEDTWVGLDGSGGGAGWLEGQSEE